MSVLSESTLAGRMRPALAVLAAGAVVATGAVAIAGPASAAASTVYVNGSAGTDNAGCGADPGVSACKTISHGIDRATAGDTVQVAAGTYHETVDIEKSIALVGAGAGSTTIDGAGQDQAVAGRYGVVYVGNAGGDVTVSGFTITNPIEFAGSDGAPETVVLQDSSATDTVTITDNTITGNANLPADDFQVGVYAFKNKATTVVSDNDISGVFQGVFLEDNGPATVSGNTIHGLVAASAGGTTYPAEGVYFLSDLAGDITAQVAKDNTFKNYAGIGVKLSAGYDNGNCSTTPCDGSLAASVTGNTFALAGAMGTATAAALQLKAVNAGNALAVELGDNTGTVAAPTKPIDADAGNGTITVTTSGAVDTIVPTPGPSVTFTSPATVTAGAAPVAYTGSVDNTNGVDIDNARYDFALTGDSGLTADQVTLEYSDGTSWHAIPLTGSTANGGAITGYFGPATGFDLAAGQKNTTPLRISLAGDAPAGTLTSTVKLDQVAPGASSPVINTILISTSATTVEGSGVTAEPVNVSTDPGKSVQITLAGSDADGGTLTYTHTDPAHGTLTGTGAELTYTPADDFTGTDTFDYTATNADGGFATATVTITVGNPVPAKIRVAGIRGVRAGGTEKIAVAVRDSDGNLAANTPVSIVVNGANYAAGTVTTNAKGRASFSYHPAYIGKDTVHATAGSVSDTTTVHILRPRQTPVLSAISRSRGTVNVAVQTHPAVAHRKVRVYYVHKVHGHKATLVQVGWALTNASGRAHLRISLPSGATLRLKARMAGNKDFLEKLSAPFWVHVR